MDPALRRPVSAAVAAIAITTAMDLGGLFMFSALPLLPLAAGLWLWTREPRAEIGLTFGRPRFFASALLYPVVVCGLAGLVALVTGSVDVSDTDWRKAGLNLAAVSVSTVVVATLTEEGFFRGWLWAAFERAGLGSRAVLVWTSVAFSLWHLSAVALDTDFGLPAWQVPIFLVNAALIGACWGLLRHLSGSLIVAAASHGLWNGLAYVLFGFGGKSGALGISETAIFGVEVGLLGLLLNGAAAALLWRWARSNRD